MTALVMIEAAAARFPDHIAVEEADGSAVTYRELMARARAHSAVAGVVEIPATRSADFIARCLGAWLAGAAWVPIDADDPRADAIRARLATAPDLAYAIATSGSTGTPKVVMVSHRGLPGAAARPDRRVPLAPGARALWLHAPVFDASISDWGTALASRRDARHRAGTHELAKRAITHVDLPPSLLRHLEPPPSLRVVVLGGEPCPVEEVRALARRVRVVVVYGPTEATVCSSLVVVDPETWTHPLIGEPHRGHPLPRRGARQRGRERRAVDRRRRARARLRRRCRRDRAPVRRRSRASAGTAPAIASRPSTVASRSSAGVDRQRKLGGRRIELDDIEATLRRAPGVRDAAVVARPLRERDRLLAFVDAVTPTAMRAWLARAAAGVDDARADRRSARCRGRRPASSTATRSSRRDRA